MKRRVISVEMVKQITTSHIINHMKDVVKSGEYYVETLTDNIYPSTYVFDMDQTVRWNRDEVKRRNRLISEKRSENKAERDYQASRFREDLLKLLIKHKSYLSEFSSRNLINIVSNELGRNERKLYKIQNMEKFLDKLEVHLNYLDKIYTVVDEV